MFKSVGIMETNPHKMIVRFRESSEKLLIDKQSFADLIRTITFQAKVLSKDYSQSVLFGDIPENSVGYVEITESGKGIRFVLNSGDRILYCSRSHALDVLQRRREFCEVSEMIQ